MHFALKPPQSVQRVSWAFAMVLLWFGWIGEPAQAETRALVLAADYSQARNADLQLKNTLVDARAVSAMFRKLGLQDVRVVENGSVQAWDDEVRALVGRLQPDDIALLYYAGHAVQVNGRNFFLAPDGVTLVSSDEVLSAIMGKAGGTVFLIDACRDNPFRNQASEKRQLQIKSRTMETVSLAELAKAQSGLSQMGNLRGKNTIVLFSTDPGNVAQDGHPGEGSPFANAVVRELGKRQSLDAAIRRITADVDKLTSSRQSPWRQGDLSFPLFLAGQPRFPVP
jgi:uncharacterized caspase-like protein